MLKVKYGTTEETIRLTDIYFNNTYEDWWLEHPLVKKIILDVDKSEVLAGGVIKSNILGLIPPEKLSGGVKVLIMMLHEPNKTYYGTSCGDNCAKWILEIAKIHDVTLTMNHHMKFPKEMEPLNIIFINENRMIDTVEDYFNTIYKYWSLEDKNANKDL